VRLNNNLKIALSLKTLHKTREESTMLLNELKAAIYKMIDAISDENIFF